MKIAGKELSEETIKKACECYGINFEKEFEQVHLCGFWVGVDSNEYITFTASIGDRLLCRQNIPEARRSITAIQSAIDFIENTCGFESRPRKYGPDELFEK